MTPFQRAVERLLASGEAGKARAILTAAAADGPSGAIELMRARCEMQAGRFLCARSHLAVALDQGTYGAEFWAAGLLVYQEEDTEPLKRLARAQWEVSNSLQEQAVAHELFARAMATEVVLGLGPPQALLEASRHLEDAVRFYGRSGFRENAWQTRLLAGRLTFLADRTAGQLAETHYRRVLRAATAAQDRVFQAHALTHLAQLQFQREQAENTFHNSWRLWDRANYWYGKAHCPEGEAELLLLKAERQGFAGDSPDHAFEEALTRFRAVSDLSGTLRVLCSIGTISSRASAVERARKAFLEAAAVSDEMGYPGGRAQAMLGLADACTRHGQYAEAISAYESVEQSARNAVQRSLCQLNKGSLYQRLGQTDLAFRCLNEAIPILERAGKGEQLSLAYYILGNAFTSGENWEAAIRALQYGLQFDNSNPLAQAEKLIVIAQAFIMLNRLNSRRPLESRVYQTAAQLFDTAETLLADANSAESRAVLAGAWQMRAQMEMTRSRWDLAVKHLENASQVYARLGMQMQIAMTDLQIGLALEGSARDIPAIDKSIESFRRGCDGFARSGMLAERCKGGRYMARALLKKANLCMEREQRDAVLDTCNSVLEDSCQTSDGLRLAYRERDLVQEDATRVSLRQEQTAVCDLGIAVCSMRGDTSGAFHWVQRIKGRGLLEGLAFTHLKGPLTDEMRLKEEVLISLTRSASSQEQVVHQGKLLAMFWDELSKQSGDDWIEYMRLRKAEPVSWPQTRALLS